MGAGVAAGAVCKFGALFLAEDDLLGGGTGHLTSRFAVLATTPSTRMSFLTRSTKGLSKNNKHEGGRAKTEQYGSGEPRRYWW
jgi:hypothetical protein